jgi:hypothetical protein
VLSLTKLSDLTWLCLRAWYWFGLFRSDAKSQSATVYINGKVIPLCSSLLAALLASLCACLRDTPFHRGFGLQVAHQTPLTLSAKAAHSLNTPIRIEVSLHKPNSL